MAFFIHPNQFLVFFRDPGHEVTPERLERVLADARHTVTGDASPFAVRLAAGPTLSVSIERGPVAEVLALRLMGRDREFRPLAKGCDAYVQVAFDDLDAMLDEINTLIDISSRSRRRPAD